MSASDGPWVSVASFVASFLLEGLQRCTGVLFSGILETSQESRKVACIPFVVSRAAAYISSVALKVLSSKKPEQRPEESTLLYGTLFCALGAGLSFISNDVIWLTACWGLVFGTGIGVAFPESLKVSQTFRSQTFLPVLYSASASIACTVIPFVMQVLLSSYGLSGCLLVLSAIILNAVPFILAAIYRVHFAAPKWNIRKKYNMEDAPPNNNGTGISNDAFEPEINDNSSEIRCYSSQLDAANVNKSDDHNFSANSNIHTSNTLYHNMDSNSKNLDKPQIVRNFNKNKCSTGKDIDKLVEEDVLFEVLSKNSSIREDELTSSKEDKIHQSRSVVSSGILSSVEAPPLKRGFPLEIKVHVVECTFTASDFQRDPMKGYRGHSNSLVTSCYENVDFTNPQFLKKYHKPSSLCASPSSRMHLISEDEEYCSEPQPPPGDCSASGRQPKPWNRIKKIFKPSCLVIIYAYVIYEITLVTLLTIFDDLLPEADTERYLADSVLPAFGLGGVAGRISLRYWGDRLLIEGSHATAALLFILDGVVVAGILWSPNYYWIGGFYALLGFLEIGILTSVWNLVSDYIDQDVSSALFTTGTFVCGICTLCVPYTIGLSRDDLGEYDALLQVTSVLPVLCALLCYILPRFAHSKRIRGS